MFLAKSISYKLLFIMYKCCIVLLPSTRREYMSSSAAVRFEDTNILFESDIMTVLSAREGAVTVKVERARRDSTGKPGRGFSFTREIRQEELSRAQATVDLSQLAAGTTIRRANGYCYIPQLA